MAVNRELFPSVDDQWNDAPLSHLPSPYFDPDPLTVNNPWKGEETLPPPPPLVRQNALLPNDAKMASAEDVGSSRSTTDLIVTPPTVGLKKRKPVAKETKRSSVAEELVPKKKKRLVKTQLPMLIIPDAMLEKWEVESGTFVIRPRSKRDFAAMRTSAIMSDN